MNESKTYIKVLIGTALLTAVMFAILSWPLPLYISEGIPASAHNVEVPAARHAIAGDHLQFLYRFNLMSDMLRGEIGWFRNPYEFNTGSDEERFRPGAYFFPMSGFFSVVKSFTNQAFAWNLTLWLSVWISAVFLWGWLSRFTSDKLAIFIGMFAALLVPFRWISLFGGSPSGMALMWLPLLAWGIDVAVRRATYISGAWVGLALLLCFWGDLQVFYFAVLAVPVFVLISVFGHSDMTIPWKRLYRVVPLGLVFMVLIALYYLWRKEYLSGSAMSEGRDWHELRVFSPTPDGLVHPVRGVTGAVFLGWSVIIGTLASFSLMFSKVAKRSAWLSRRVILFAAGVAMLFVTVALALGANGPFDSIFIRGARSLLPKYDMIRQPFKIYALIPMWLGWLFMMGWARMPGQFVRRNRMHMILAIIVSAGMFVEVSRSISATITLFDKEQGAYAAVAADAAANDAAPGRAMVVPLWPGESADTSLAIHLAQKYNLRLLNGYSAAVRQDYIDTIFRQFQSVNQGYLTGQQIESLKSMGINYVIVHENMFPEKVSPFPIQTTLTRLARNPGVQLLNQSGPVHAFRLRDDPGESDSAAGDEICASGFPARRWYLSRETGEHVGLVEDATAALGSAVRFQVNGATIETRRTRVSPASDLYWLLRARGKGSLKAATIWGGNVLSVSDFSVESDSWRWYRIPVKEAETYEQAHLRVEHLDGHVETDLLLLTQGDWPVEWSVGDELAIPASCFFHAGYVGSNGKSVHMREDYEPDQVVLYGPGLPVSQGTYRIDLDFSESSINHVDRVGSFRARARGGDTGTWQPIISGKPASLEWLHRGNLPLVIEFKYHRTSNISIQAVLLNRID